MNVHVGVVVNSVRKDDERASKANIIISIYSLLL